MLLPLALNCVLSPINPSGNHVHPSLEECISAIQNTKMIVIGMKVLSCGLIKPHDAFKFVFQYVKSAMIGFTESWQIEKAYNIYKGLFAEDK